MSGEDPHYSFLTSVFTGETIVHLPFSSIKVKQYWVNAILHFMHQTALIPLGVLLLLYAATGCIRVMLSPFNSIRPRIRSQHCLLYRKKGMWGCALIKHTEFSPWGNLLSRLSTTVVHFFSVIQNHVHKLIEALVQFSD